jgi:hypothetical protein
VGQTLEGVAKFCELSEAPSREKLHCRFFKDLQKTDGLNPVHFGALSAEIG